MGYQWDSMRYYWDIDVILIYINDQCDTMGYVGISGDIYWMSMGFIGIFVFI